MNNYEYWLENIDEKDELKSFSKKDIKESFYKDLEFGTGGLRGIIGLGTNRMNKYTVRHATQGLAEEIKSHGQVFMDKGVVIAFDSRNKSYEFAVETAKVLCANGIKTYLFNSLRPTPELSFAVRYLGCCRGIVITASHNPKEYNGYKIYGEDGGQLPPAATDLMIKYINKLDMFKDVKVGKNNAFIIGQEVDDAYIDAVYEQKLNIKIPDDFKIVYTPLYGAGNLLVRKILQKIGVKNNLVVKEQELPNGDFPTVKVPNPENKDVFNLAIKIAEKENADLIIGTDPDSDRIGVVVRTNSGEFAVLNGNQTGVLLADFILKNIGSMPHNPYIVKTIVTSDMVSKIAGEYNVNVDNVLTGFKFIGEKIKEYENTGKSFIFGLEESYGYLKGTYARDKDAVVAAMLVAQMAAYYKEKGLTLYDGLVGLYKKYGCYMQELVSITCEGIEGHSKIDAIMRNLRTCNVENAISVIDYLKGIDGLPKSNVLKFIFENGWIVVRPSGTEPKIKIYFELKGNKESSVMRELINFKNFFIDNYI